jgi:hypothetical protein
LQFQTRNSLAFVFFGDERELFFLLFPLILTFLLIKSTLSWAAFSLAERDFSVEMCPLELAGWLVRSHQMEIKIQKIKIEGKLWLRLMKPTKRDANKG